MRLLLRLVFGCTVLSPGVSTAPGQAALPNVVVILADDLGWGDMRANNPDRCRIPTPHMDRLAAGGMRFTDAHSSSACCTPSRYTLLTGRYHWRTTLQSGIAWVWGAPLIAPDRLTIASLAASRGYATACIGKWHLGWKWPITPAQKSLFTGLGGWQGGGDVSTEITQAHRDAWQAVFSQPIAEGPTTRGFDQYFGTDVPNWPPYCFIDDDRTVGVPSELLSPELVRRNQADLQGPAVPGWKLEPILPAILDVPLPANAGEDSFSLLPLLGGSEQPIRTSAVNTAYSGLPSYREAAWKYVAAATPELYQLDDDPAESVNLAEKHPERLADMRAAFEKIIRDGRSTPGAPRENDVQVTRYPQ